MALAASLVIVGGLLEIFKEQTLGWDALVWGDSALS